MTAPLPFCDRCPGRLALCDVLSNATTCVECVRRSLRPTSEWAIFCRALREAAVGGVVHQRDVRPLVSGRIKPQSVGRCYSRAIREGLITEVRRERSNDVAGRNTNKLEPVYARAA
jgi:hypothetical protein